MARGPTGSGSAAHRPESAGEHVVTRIPVAHAEDSAETAVRRLSEPGIEAFEAVYVVDSTRRLLGAVDLASLHRAPPRQRVGEFMDQAYPRVEPHHDQEHAAVEALRRRTSSVAVVSGDGRLVGAIPALALLDILRREHVEDLHRLAGIQREQTRDRSAIESPPTRRARHRLPWLLVGLAGSMLAALVVSRFERVLHSNVAVAYFVPAIVYLADAIGTQTEAIVVRSLSLSRLSLRHILGAEVKTGLIIGFSLAALSFPMVVATFGEVRLAIAVSTAILVAGGVATTVGLVLPWSLQRLGSDPALGSGPLATIVQDVLSLLIYFLIVARLLG